MSENHGIMAAMFGRFGLFQPGQKLVGCQSYGTSWDSFCPGGIQQGLRQSLAQKGEVWNRHEAMKETLRNIDPCFSFW